MEEELVREDLNKLLGTALGIAQEQLQTHGAFVPVGLVVDLEGEISLVAVAPNEAEDPTAELDADAMITDLFAALTEQKAQNRAAAVVCDIYLPEETTDAVHVMAEHSTGVGISAVQPYKNDAGTWTFAEPFLEAGEVQIWV